MIFYYKRGGIMKDRIKLLRKSLYKTQKEMGIDLGVTDSAITQIEKGKSNISDQLIKLICKTYNVSESWLRTGEGEMFVENDGTILAALVAEYDLNDIEEKILKTYLELPDGKREAVKDFIVDFVRSLQEMETESAGEMMPTNIADLSKPLSPAEHAKILRDRADAIEKGVAESITSESDIVA
jgi:transcriptional regulator with XRE-family HTH domain